MFSIFRNPSHRGDTKLRIVTAVSVASAIILSIAGVSALTSKDDNRPATYVKKATARETFDATMKAVAENSVHIGPWYYAGPFDNTNNNGLDKAYPPEQSVDLNAEYTSKGGASIRWKKAENFKDGHFCDLRLFDDNDWIVVYAFRQIETRTAMDYNVAVSADDGVAIWLNGEKVRIRDGQVNLNLKAGKNDVLLKVSQLWGGFGFTFGLPDPQKQIDEVIEAISKDFPNNDAHQLEIDNANTLEYGMIMKQIANKNEINRFASTTLNSAALIADSDIDPADVVLRRTRALLTDLMQSNPSKDWTALNTQLKALETKNSNVDRADGFARTEFYKQACQVRRKIAFSNPLLNFDKILFAKHTRCGNNEGLGNHMCDQYFGWKAVPGGGIFILEKPFSSAPVVKDVLQNSPVTNGRLKGTKLTQKGSYLSPSLSYDGKTIYFAYTEKSEGDLWSPGKSYHVFKVNVDGTNLVQLTDGPWNEFDPYQMPNGRLVFISERRGGYGRCHGRPVPVYTLHTMKKDGSDITCISYHESNEWHPAINNDGMIVYSRWDYVDRGFNQAHHPWITTPDGRDPRPIHGNYPVRAQDRPWLEVHMRPIPGSHKYVAVAGPHHGQSYGSLILIDPRVPDDEAMSSVRRITPEAAFPEGEDNKTYPYGMTYGTAWPLSEKYYIGVYDAKSDIHGIWLIDAFGNREFIYCDANVGCLAPMPLRPRKTPPIVPDMAKPADSKVETGTVALMNVYDSLKPWPKDTKIKYLRIMQVLPKTTFHADNPRVGYGDQKSARAVLGTVPVEADGSAYFTAPAKKPIYFQALDENGMAVQNMRSDTYLRPGERLACQGCHNQVNNSPSRNVTPVALKRSPSTITPDVDGSRPFNYPRLVQDVLNRNCFSCHSKHENAPNLSGEDSGRNGWSKSYVTLRDFAFFFDNAAFTTSNSIPGEFGAKASRLYKMLSGGHHGLNLSAEDMHRLTLWLDSNSDFYGGYDNTPAQSRGEVVWPLLE